MFMLKTEILVLKDPMVPIKDGGEGLSVTWPCLGYEERAREWSQYGA